MGTNDLLLRLKELQKMVQTADADCGFLKAEIPFLPPTAYSQVEQLYTHDREALQTTNSELIEIINLIEK